jgi:hypothetical protein
MPNMPNQAGLFCTTDSHLALGMTGRTTYFQPCRADHDGASDVLPKRQDTGVAASFPVEAGSGAVPTMNGMMSLMGAGTTLQTPGKPLSRGRAL